jgi:hypothetical protein
MLNLAGFWSIKVETCLHVLAQMVKINDFPLAVQKEWSRCRVTICIWLGIERRETFEEVAH